MQQDNEKCCISMVDHVYSIYKQNAVLLWLKYIILAILNIDIAKTHYNIPV